MSREEGVKVVKSRNGRVKTGKGDKESIKTLTVNPLKDNKRMGDPF